MKVEDWQTGNESKINSLQRGLLNQQWLDSIHKELKEKLEDKKPKEEEPTVIGFPD